LGRGQQRNGGSDFHGLAFLGNRSFIHELPQMAANGMLSPERAAKDMSRSGCPARAGVPVGDLGKHQGFHAVG
jgi:hypothetical protein